MRTGCRRYWTAGGDRSVSFAGQSALSCRRAWNRVPTSLTRAELTSATATLVSQPHSRYVPSSFPQDQTETSIFVFAKMQMSRSMTRLEIMHTAHRLGQARPIRLLIRSSILTSDGTAEKYLARSLTPHPKRTQTTF